MMKMSRFALGALGAFSVLVSQAAASGVISREARECSELSTGTTPADIIKLKSAALSVAKNVRTFFDSRQEYIHEREQMLDLIELALIAKEHVLVVGAPGTAKSFTVDSLFGNLVESDGKTSYFKRALNPETTQSDTHGPIDWERLQEDNVYRRLLKEGMLFHRVSFLDEAFNVRRGAFSNIFDILQERSVAQGSERTAGKIESVVSATNTTIAQLYRSFELAQRQGEPIQHPRAMLGRYGIVLAIAPKLEFVESHEAMIQGAGRSQAKPEQLSFDDLDKVRALVPLVEIPSGVARFMTLLEERFEKQLNLREAEAMGTRPAGHGAMEPIPFRSTRDMSPRTRVLAAKILRAHVVKQWMLSNGARSLSVTIEDVQALVSALTINGPADEFAKMMQAATPVTRQDDKSLLETVVVERGLFQKEYELLAREVEVATNKIKAEGIETEPTTSSTDAKLVQSLEQLAPHVEKRLRTSELNPDFIAETVARDRIVSHLESVPHGKKILVEVEARLETARQERLAQEVRKREDDARIAREKRLAEIAADLERARRENLKVALEKYGNELKEDASWVQVASTEFVSTAGQMRMALNLGSSQRVLIPLIHEKKLLIVEPNNSIGTTEFSTMNETLVRNLSKEPVSFVSLGNDLVMGIRDGVQVFIFQGTDPFRRIFSNFLISSDGDILTSAPGDGKSFFVLDKVQKKLRQFNALTGQQEGIDLDLLNDKGDATGVAAMLANVTSQHLGHDNQFQYPAATVNAPESLETSSLFYVVQGLRKAFFTSKGSRDLYSIDLSNGHISHERALVDPSVKEAVWKPITIDRQAHRAYFYAYEGKLLRVLELDFKNPDKAETHVLGETQDEKGISSGVVMAEGGLLIVGTESRGLAALDLINNKIIGVGLNGTGGTSRWPFLTNDNRIGFYDFVETSQDKKQKWKLRLSELKPRLQY